MVGSRIDHLAKKAEYPNCSKDLNNPDMAYRQLLWFLVYVNFGKGRYQPPLALSFCLISWLLGNSFVYPKDLVTSISCNLTRIINITRFIIPNRSTSILKSTWIDDRFQRSWVKSHTYTLGTGCDVPAVTFVDLR